MKKTIFFIFTVVFILLFLPSPILGEGRIFEFESNTYTEYWLNNNQNYISFDSVETNGTKERETLHRLDFFEEDNKIKDGSFIPIPNYITSLDQVNTEINGIKPAHILNPISHEAHTGIQIINNYLGTGERRLYIPIFTVPELARQSGLISQIGTNPPKFRYDNNIKFKITFAEEPYLEIIPSERTVKRGEVGNYQAVMVYPQVDGTEKRYDITTRNETTWSKQDGTGRATIIGKGRFRGEEIGDINIYAKFRASNGLEYEAEHAKLYVQDFPLGLSLTEYCNEAEVLNVRAVIRSEDELSGITWTLLRGSTIVHTAANNLPSAVNQFVYPIEKGVDYKLLATVVYSDGRMEELEEDFNYNIDCGIPDLFISKIQSPTVVHEGNRVVTTIEYGSLATTLETKVSKIRLYLNNELVGEREVAIPPGVTRTIYMEWTANQTGNNIPLVATINIPAEFTERTMENNKKSTNVTVKEAIEPDTNFCTDPTKTSGLHLTLQECTVIPGSCSTDEDGNESCSDPYCVYSPIDFNEYMEVRIIDIKPKRMRAGYGFDFVVETEYYNEGYYNSSNGAEIVYSDFVEEWISDYLETPIELEVFEENKSESFFSIQTGLNEWTDLVSYREVKKWRLPEVFLERYSGNAFYDTNHVMRDIYDELISGKHKWYVSFDTPDGKYPFASRVEGGITSLKDCEDNDEIEIDGVAYDDFVIREVSVITPFPAGVGWNWAGSEAIITDQYNEWYNYPSSHWEYYATPDFNNRVYVLNNCSARKVRESNDYKEWYSPNDLYEFFTLYNGIYGQCNTNIKQHNPW